MSYRNDEGKHCPDESEFWTELDWYSSMTQNVEGEELAWQNMMLAVVVEACLGRIEPEMRAIWLEYGEGREVTIHVRLSALSEELAEATSRIEFETIALGLGYLDDVHSQIHLDLVDPPNDIARYRWVFIQKY